MASEKTILEILNWLDLNTDQDLIKERIPLYIQVLSDLPDHVIKQAALAHVSASRFFPHPSELRTVAFEILAELDPTPSKYDAWSEVQEAIRRVGHVGKPEFSHPMIAKVVSIFGWKYLCLSTNTMADRVHFFKTYTSLLADQEKKKRWPEKIQHFIEEQIKRPDMLTE